MIIRLDKL